ncbi:hypothetical protein BC826DRAFT_408225 [Russula brevipes]|nr:hypothetical protein BC826DRAFT_408225 [Russula brevipes]
MSPRSQSALKPVSQSLRPHRIRLQPVPSFRRFAIPCHLAAPFAVACRRLASPPLLPISQQTTASEPRLAMPFIVRHIWNDPGAMPPPGSPHAPHHSGFGEPLEDFLLKFEELAELPSHRPGES